MLLNGFFMTESVNPQPYSNPVIVNLTGASKFEQNTTFVPGKYKIEIAPGANYVSLLDLVYPSGVYMVYEEDITTEFIVRAYCGSDATSSSVGTNPYSGAYKVNGINPGDVSRVPGIDVNHIFGAGGGNGNYGTGVGSKRRYGGGPNCLGDGNYYTDGFFNTTNYYGAGSCLHLLPVGGTFGIDYIRAYQVAPSTVSSGSAHGGGSTGPGPSTGHANNWFTRGGNSPYGLGATTEDTRGGGIGAEGEGAYFNGNQWVIPSVYSGTQKTSLIKITYLGPLFS